MRVWSVATAVALALLWGVCGHAGPVQFSDVSANATWLAHINADAMRSSVVMAKAYDACVAETPLAEHFDKMAKRWGLDLREGLHGLTLYGTEMTPGHGVAILRAKMDKDQLVRKAEESVDYQTERYGDYEIHTWTKSMESRDHTVAGAFYQPHVLVMASDSELLKTALDVLEGEAESLEAGEGPLATEVAEGTIFLARARRIDDSEIADRFPICSQLVGLDYAEGERGRQWFGHIKVRAESQEIAATVEDALNGLRAVLWLGAEPAPKLQQLLGRVQIDRDGQVVTAKFSAPAQEVAAAMPGACKLISKHLARHRAMMRGYNGQAGTPTEQSETENSERNAGRRSAEPYVAEGVAVAEGTQATEREGARQGTPVLGIVVGTPADVEAAEVLRVWQDSPAEKTGLQAGDLIIELDGKAIGSPEELRRAVLMHDPGDRVQLVVRRGGEQQEFQARLAGADNFNGRTGGGPLERILSPRPWLGIRPGQASVRGVSVADVVPGSPADRAGLEAGDAILRVDKTRVEAPADLQMAIAGYSPGETVRLTVLRDSERRQIEVKLGAFGVLGGELDEQARQLLDRFLEGRMQQEGGLQ